MEMKALILLKVFVLNLKKNCQTDTVRLHSLLTTEISSDDIGNWFLL